MGSKSKIPTKPKMTPGSHLFAGTNIHQCFRPSQDRQQAIFLGGAWLPGEASLSTGTSLRDLDGDGVRDGNADAPGWWPGPGTPWQMSSHWGLPPAQCKRTTRGKEFPLKWQLNCIRTSHVFPQSPVFGKPNNDNNNKNDNNTNINNNNNNNSI